MTAIKSKHQKKTKRIIILIVILVLAVILFLIASKPKYQIKRPLQDKNFTRLHHPKKDQEFTEWWYFDAELNNHLSFVLNFRASSAKEENFVELAIYNKQNNSQTIYHQGINPDQIEFDPNQYRIKFGNHQIIKEKDYYLVTIKDDKFYFHFKLQPEIDGFSLNLDYPLSYFSLTPWVVHVPRGQISAVLKNDKRRYELKGLGYHDHNYFPSRRFFPYYRFKGWYWARLFTDNYTVITSKAFNRQMQSTFFVFKDSQLIKEAIGDTMYENSTLDNKQIPQILNIYHPPIGVAIIKKSYPRKTNEYRHLLNDCLVIDYREKEIIKEKGTGLSELIFSTD